MKFTEFRFFGSVLLTVVAGGLIAGCSSSAPAPVPPPNVAMAVPVAVLTPEQLNKLRQASPDTARRVQVNEPLTAADVKLMAKLEIPADSINEQIRNSHSVYYLKADEIVDLKQSGVPEPVIDVMITTPSAAAASPQVAPPGGVDAAAGAQTPPPAPLVEVQPPAPSTEYVWVDGDWAWRGGWVWVPGRWAVPPYRGGIWFHGGWVHGGAGFRREGGRWRRWR